MQVIRDSSDKRWFVPEDAKRKSHHRYLAVSSGLPLAAEQKEYPLI